MLTDHDPVEHVLVLGGEDVGHGPYPFAVGAVDRGASVQYLIGNGLAEIHGASIEPTGCRCLNPVSREPPGGRGPPSSEALMSDVGA
jgi:hypothetical protein